MKNLTKESILQAIQRIDENPNLIKGRESFQYDLVHEGKRYPPILVISEAHKILGGEELMLRDFGNNAKKAFLNLGKHGFMVEEKASFYSELKKFLNQAKTTDLKYSHYRKEFLGLKVRASFGKGNIARIPWISFLGDNNRTDKGIYPVYLFYKDLDKLILSFGVSETEKPSQSWNISEAVKIKQYFKEKSWPEPARYGDSYVYKVYDVNNLPPSGIIDHDLNDIVTIYKNQISEQVSNKKPTVVIEDHSTQNPNGDYDSFIQSFQRSIQNAGLLYSNTLLTRFIASLVTKPFVILTGLSGSGKTKLAQAFVQWISKDDNQYCIVPVGADWTNREPLLGYPNALNPEEYVKPDNGVLDLLMRAIDNPELPYFLILDEMNLSHVERYFADFLSVMESKGDIPLYAEGTVNSGVPAKLPLPDNLFIIGTVNIDETTNMFSPKVLDRANTIEFRINKQDMELFLGEVKRLDMKALKTKGADMASSFLNMSKNNLAVTNDKKDINIILLHFFGELKKTGAEFGFRSASEIFRLITQLSVLDDSLLMNDKVDIAIMQKLLPKLHGSRRKLCPVLEKLGVFCINGNTKIVNDVFEQEDFDFENNPNVIYKLSLEKISRMYKCAVDNGFASFAEA